MGQWDWRDGGRGGGRGAEAVADKGLVINYGEGGGLQNGKIADPKLFAPPLKTG